VCEIAIATPQGGTYSGNAVACAAPTAPSTGRTCSVIKGRWWLAISCGDCLWLPPFYDSPDLGAGAAVRPNVSECA
jgi:hypothetical protein